MQSCPSCAMTNPAGLTACVRCSTPLAPAAGEVAAASAAPAAAPVPARRPPPAPADGGAPFRTPAAADRFRSQNGPAAEAPERDDPYGYYGTATGGSAPAGWGPSPGSGRPSAYAVSGTAAPSSHGWLLILMFAVVLGGIVATWWFVLRPSDPSSGVAVGGSALRVSAPPGYDTADDAIAKDAGNFLESVGNHAGVETGLAAFEKDDGSTLIVMSVEGDAATMDEMQQQMQAMPEQLQQMAGMSAQVTPYTGPVGQGTRVKAAVPSPQGTTSMEMVFISGPSLFVYAVGAAPPGDFQQFLDSFRIA